MQANELYYGVKSIHLQTSWEHNRVIIKKYIHLASFTAAHRILGSRSYGL